MLEGIALVSGTYHAGIEFPFPVKPFTTSLVLSKAAWGLVFFNMFTMPFPRRDVPFFKSTLHSPDEQFGEVNTHIGFRDRVLEL